MPKLHGDIAIHVKSTGFISHEKSRTTIDCAGSQVDDGSVAVENDRDGHVVVLAAVEVLFYTFLY